MLLLKAPMLSLFHADSKQVLFNVALELNRPEACQEENFTSCYFAFYSPTIVFVMSCSFGSYKPRLHPFCIACKRCRETIAAPVQTMPSSWIVATCPLCGEKRRYLPVELFQGTLSWAFQEWQRQTGKPCL
jgi:hypothetical protein